MLTFDDIKKMVWMTADNVVAAVKKEEHNFEDWEITSDIFCDSDEIADAFALTEEQMGKTRTDWTAGTVEAHMLYRYICHEVRMILYTTGYIKTLVMQDADNLLQPSGTPYKQYKEQSLGTTSITA